MSRDLLRHRKSRHEVAGLSEPTVPGGMQERAALLGGSLKQGMWVITQVTRFSPPL